MKMTEFSQDRSDLPKIEAMDITSYLVLIFLIIIIALLFLIV